MQSKIKELTKSVKDKGAHIFYPFRDDHKYINNVLFYLHAALEQGHHVMLIENDRLMPIIEGRLEKEFSSDQIEMVHKMNNYDFYCYRGNFHTETIFGYFQKIVAPYIEKNITIQTWAHVEWREQDQIFNTIGEYEQESDKIQRDMDLVSVCAYDENRLPESLKKTLIDCHNYIMTDDSLEENLPIKMR